VTILMFVIFFLFSYAAFGVVIAIAYGAGVGWPSLVSSLILAGVMGSVGSALHSSFHVKGFALERYAWYRELRALHYLHHLGDMKSNFAVLNMGLDATFKSLRIQDPMRARASSKTDPTIELETLELVKRNGNLSSYLLFNGMELNEFDEEAERQRALRRGYPSLLLRLVLLIVGVWAWQTTEANVVSPPFDAPDKLHDLFEPLRQTILSKNSFATICLVKLAFFFFFVRFRWCLKLAVDVIGVE
jgi:hypothetical protein